MSYESPTDRYFACILNVQRELTVSLATGDAAASWRSRAEAYVKADVWAVLQLRECLSSP
jgi:hypothetical protein